MEETNEVNYDHLIDKKVVYIINGKEINCIVKMIDRAIGLTLMDADVEDSYRVCMSGPLAPHFEGYTRYPELIVEYERLFDSYVIGIEAGVIIDEEMYNIKHDSQSECGYASQETCPFGQ